ncbi:helix-turn-helix domain-containing protein [Dyella telluris]|uniref:Helix-turn-helix transcriptional regulator n=1 Tax=Dyella telluris TaxID=2763498 RepID=A0A7G8Q0E5_9GAMM|nr:helix-turn-helix transcriptional regulator [Dyella telluris]QNK00253.1 helix-turn-helix transcriptional regulator [Dyella telluris]
MNAVAVQQRPVGDLLREWRRHRRLSQLDLASGAEISTRHLSFMESGRAQPSRDMILRLCEYLDIPLRERNQLLVAAGFAAVYRERTMADPALSTVLGSIRLLLKGLEPYPALAVDRHWNLVESNQATQRLLAGLAPRWLTPPINVLRVSLHPEGLAPHIRNLPVWRAHLLDRLRRQIDATHDQELVSLYQELRSYPGDDPSTHDFVAGEVAIPMELALGDRVLSMLSTTTVFGTPMDVTLAELALEAFVPADEATVRALRDMAASTDGAHG